MAIIDLTYAYCWALDEHRWDGLDTVFTEDATAELGSPLLTGREEIKRRVEAALSPLDDSQHMVTNHVVIFTRHDGGAGDTATSRCYLQAQHVRRRLEGGSNFVIGGRYEDEAVRTPQGWRLRHRRLIVMWREGNPAVLHPR